MSETVVSSEVAEWVDKMAIRDVIARWSDASTRGAWDEFEALSTPDTVWDQDHPIDKHLVGARAITEDVSASLPKLDFFLQMPHTSVVDLVGDDRATATTMIHAVGRSKDFSFTNYGIYYDELVKLDGRWKFASRRLVLVYSDPTPHSGTVAVSRADIAQI
jgi:ketosteroid isomerase-like protein